MPKNLFMAIAGSMILSKNGRKGEGERRGKEGRGGGKRRKEEMEKGRRGEEGKEEKGRNGEREKGRGGEGEKERSGEREKRRKGDLSEMSWNFFPSPKQTNGPHKIYT